jgi:hypothetical protein
MTKKVCRHYDTSLVNRLGGMASVERGDVYARRCFTCGQLHPLGPASITSDVAIELRAAELVDILDDAYWLSIAPYLDGYAVEYQLAYVIANTPAAKETQP